MSMFHTEVSYASDKKKKMVNFRREMTADECSKVVLEIAESKNEVY